MENDRTDPNGLDADNDGQACESFDYGDTVPDNGNDVIRDTIPGQKELPSTGGPPILGLLLAIGLTGIGIMLLRRL